MGRGGVGGRTPPSILSTRGAGWLGAPSAAQYNPTPTPTPTLPLPLTLTSSRSQLRFFAERLEESRPAFRRICCETEPEPEAIAPGDDPGDPGDGPLDPLAPLPPLAPGDPGEACKPCKPWEAGEAGGAADGGGAPPQLEAGAMQPRRVSCTW